MKNKSPLAFFLVASTVLTLAYVPTCYYIYALIKDTLLNDLSGIFAIISVFSIAFVVFAFVSILLFIIMLIFINHDEVEEKEI